MFLFIALYSLMTSQAGSTYTIVAGIQITGMQCYHYRNKIYLILIVKIVLLVI